MFLPVGVFLDSCVAHSGRFSALLQYCWAVGMMTGNRLVVHPPAVVPTAMTRGGGVLRTNTPLRAPRCGIPYIFLYMYFLRIGTDAIRVLDGEGIRYRQFDRLRL